MPLEYYSLYISDGFQIVKFGIIKDYLWEKTIENIMQGINAIVMCHNDDDVPCGKDLTLIVNIFTSLPINTKIIE